MFYPYIVIGIYSRRYIYGGNEMTVYGKIGRHLSEKSRFTIELRRYCRFCDYGIAITRRHIISSKLMGYRKLTGCELIVSHNADTITLTRNAEMYCTFMYSFGSSRATNLGRLLKYDREILNTWSTLHYITLTQRKCKNSVKYRPLHARRRKD